MIDDSKLKKYFQELKTIQDSQILQCETNIELDLDKMIFERNRAFENLRNAVSLMPISVLKRFADESEAVINRDKILMDRLKEHKNKIGQKINHTIKGKQLLKGYSVNQKKSLRFMNNKI